MSCAVNSDVGGPTFVRPGTVIWITGLSGAGKSTLAREVYALIHERMANVVYLDGDILRAILGNDLSHTTEDRLRNAYRISRFCKHLSDQGIHVVCATISLFHECQAWNRRHMQGYFEVYVRVPMDVLIERDPKGIYARALKGEQPGVVGIDQPFDEPRKPEMVVDNTAHKRDLRDIAINIVSRSGIFLA